MVAAGHKMGENSGCISSKWDTTRGRRMEDEAKNMKNMMMMIIKVFLYFSNLKGGNELNPRKRASSGDNSYTSSLKKQRGLSDLQLPIFLDQRKMIKVL